MKQNEICVLEEIFNISIITEKFIFERCHNTFRQKIVAIKYYIVLNTVVTFLTILQQKTSTIKKLNIEGL